MKTNLEKAIQLHQSGDYQQAQDLYQQILADEPSNAEANHLMGLLAAQQNQIDTAIQWFEKAVALQQGSALFHNSLANAYKGNKAFAKAEQHYQQSIKLKPDYAQAHNNYGGSLLMQEAYDDALRQFQQAVQIDPAYLEAHLNLGNLLLRQNNLSAAEKQFLNVLQLNPKQLYAHHQLGNICLQQDKLVDAEKHFQSVLAIDEEHLETLNNMGVICLKKSEPQQAVEYFAKVLALDDEYLDARSNIAATFLQNDRYPQAIRQYKEYLKLKPDNLEANYNIAVAFMSLGHLEDAIRHYQIVIEHNPQHANAEANLGAIYLRLEQRDNAVEHFQKALEIDPNNPSVQYMLRALRGDKGLSKTPSEYIKNLFDNYAIQYDQHLVERLHYQIPLHLRNILKEACGQESAEWNIVDLGCGTGLSGEEFKDYSKHIIGVDLSDKMIAVAKQKNIYDELVSKNISEYLEDTKEKFDLIIAADVFGYIGELESIFKLCKKALSSEGLFTFSVEKTLQQPFELKSTARFAHSLEYIQELAQKTGFNIVKWQEVTARVQNEKPLGAYVFVLTASIQE